jgi:hypothetical protein
MDFYIRTDPHIAALCLGDARAEIIEPGRLWQFSKRKKQIVECLIGLRKVRAEQPFAPDQMKMIWVHESNVSRR